MAYYLPESDGALQAPSIVPISSLLTSSATQRRAYNDVLDSFSKPFMVQYRDDCGFATRHIVYADGVPSEFTFSADDDAMHAWRYLDLTPHVIFLSSLLEKTIRTN